MIPSELSFVHAPAGHLGDCRAVMTERGGGASTGPFATLNLGRSTPDDPQLIRVNEALVLQTLGIPDLVARLRLEHGNKVLSVDEPGLFGPADALLTERPELVLWLTVADCLPLVLVAGSVRALAHCGWRGLSAGIVEETVAALAHASKTPPSAFRAWIGPGIGPCCYPVEADVARLFPASVLAPPAAAQQRLDLGHELDRRLLSSGLPGDAVARADTCTSCRPDRFFSHRRDRAPTGRMAVLCWMAPVARKSSPTS